MRSTSGGGATLFIGITTWNSELFIGHALAAWRRHTGTAARLVVWDNASTDSTASLVRAAGAELVVRAASQADALNGLWRMAREPYVLLTHADVLVLSERWFELCAEAVRAPDVALVSPEDVGCGPYTRPFGADMPESSFLFAHRERLRRIESRLWRRRGPLRYFRRGLDLYAPHVTHRLPSLLADAGLAWRRMEVQPSSQLATPRYGPYPGAAVWTEELGRLQYGLGNFYHLDGVVTHYHNWYERVPRAEPALPAAPAPVRDFPSAYVRDYTAAFLSDYSSGRLQIPPAQARQRQPVEL